MTERLRYKAFGYRIVFDIQNEIEEHVDSKLEFCENNTNEKLRLKHIIFDLKPKTCVASSSEKNCSCRANSKQKSKKTVSQLLLEKSNFPTDSTSSEGSFYSCKSCASASEESHHVSCRSDSSENDSESGKEFCNQITVLNKIFLTSRLHKTIPKKHSRRNISNSKIITSLKKSEDLKHIDEKYEDNINLNSSDENQKCEENNYYEKRIVIMKLSTSKLKFSTWEPVCDQGSIIEMLRLRIFPQNEIYNNDKMVSLRDWSKQKQYKQDNTENNLSTSNSLKIFSGEGDFLENQFPLNNTITQLSKTFFMKNSNEACLIMLIKKSLNESQYRTSQFQTIGEQSTLLLQPKETLSDFSEKFAINNTFEQTFPILCSSENSSHISETSEIRQNIENKEETTKLSSVVKEAKNEKEGERCAKQENRLKHPQTIKLPLPVIKEESLESLCSDFEEYMDTDNYCLVDSDERPIRLFDFAGFPLTDHSGRPLKDVKGNFLMKCDENGIPVVDFEDCNIFDMFGNRPDDEEFDPSAAPEASIGKKMLASTVILYDIDGNPLTSVSGTPLVDSCGRSLISQDNW